MLVVKVKKLELHWRQSLLCTSECVFHKENKGFVIELIKERKGVFWCG